MYIYIEEMRRVGGRGDIRKQDWWYDERGEGMRSQRADGQVTGDCSRALEKKKETVAETIARMLPCANWLHKIRRRPDDLCARCTKAAIKHTLCWWKDFALLLPRRW